MNQFLNSLVLPVSLLFFMESCSTILKPYERQYINDSEMSMTGSSTVKFHQYVCTIREGAVAAEDKKGSGGCGCN